MRGLLPSPELRPHRFDNGRSGDVADARTCGAAAIEKGRGIHAERPSRRVGTAGIMHRHSR